MLKGQSLKLLLVYTLLLLLFSNAAIAQEGTSTPTIQFTAYQGNPVLARTDPDEWGGENGTIFAPQVIKHDGGFYMFYTGSSDRSESPLGIGLATSTDGIHWTAHEGNPILEPDGTGYDAMCISGGVPIFDGNQWVLYFAANSTPCEGTGRHIGRATADNPSGTWVSDPEAILEAGAPGEWDAGFIMPHAVIRTDDGYVMFYSGGEEYLLPLPRLIGMATSPDGVVWTKHNDPATTEPPYADSDPLIEINDDGTESYLQTWAIDILKTPTGWEMFFSAACPKNTVTAPTGPKMIFYGTSEDGIHWKTYRNPEMGILTCSQVVGDWAEHCICYPSVIKLETEYLLYFTGCSEIINDCQIGMATGTITWNSTTQQ